MNTNTSSATFLLLPTTRVLLSKGLLLILSALILLFAAVGTVPPVMAER